VTALFDRIAKAASTTAFRWSAAAVASYLLAAAFLIGFLFSKTNDILTEQTLAGLRAEARFLLGEAAAGGAESLRARVAALSRPDGPGLYFLSDAAGGKLAGNLNRIPPELAGNPDGGIFAYQPQRTTNGRPRLAVAFPMSLPGGQSLLIGRDIDDQRAYAETVWRTFLLGFGALSLLGLLGGLTVSRLILNRMDTITATSRSIMSGDLSRRIPIDGTGGELDALAHNLNDMLDRIEGLMSGLKEVSDNIAHDLKTPLNRLRNSAEAALRESRGADGYREGLERTIEKADELIKTFNALLLIARLEAGALEESLETFDLGALVEDVSDLYTPAAEEAGFNLSIEARPGVRVRANKQLMGQAVANLIDNAIKYSAASGVGNAITVKSGALGDGAFVSVADRGPGISACDRARALKRFVRLEESRTKPGTGLGLSLVAAVARLHHGEVRLEDNDPGLRVVLVLPRRCMIASVSEGDGRRLEVAAS